MKSTKVLFAFLIIGVTFFLFSLCILGNDVYEYPDIGPLEINIVSNSTSSLSSIATIQIEQQNKKLQLIRQNRCNINISLKHGNCICDYVNLKGLPKSGTSWMIASLQQIQKYFCDEQLNIEICTKPWHLGSYNRHDLLSPRGETDNERLLSHFENKSALLNELKHKRFCSIIAFRDPRDRMVSSSHWNIRGNKIIMNDTKLLYDKINQMTVRDYQQYGCGQYNEYWNLFRNAELSEPMEFYNYFYDDMVLDPFEGIKNILSFIGFYSLPGIVVTDNDIQNILTKITSDALIEHGANILYRKGKVCGFHTELTVENANIINNQTAYYLNPELIQKFNKTCFIPSMIPSN